ncbi:MAG: hypothetical protein V3T90_08980 [Anaerolineae bacterium]
MIEDQPFAQRIAQLRDDFFSGPARAGDEFGIGGDAGDEAQFRRTADIPPQMPNRGRWPFGPSFALPVTSIPCLVPKRKM